MSRSLRTVVAFCLAVCMSLALAAVASADTYTVSEHADASGSTCASSCTLRQAINAANAHSGADTINFSTGPGLITVDTPLPAITGAVTIDGTAEGGLRIWGGFVDRTTYPNADGFDVEASDVTIKGIAAVDWPQDGILIGSGTDNVTISGDQIGVDADGVTSDPNGRDGIEAFGTNFTIASNVIAANARNGIYVGPGAEGGTIEFNNIGRGQPSSGAPGTANGGAAGAALGNGHDGIAVDNAGSLTVPFSIGISGNVIANNTNSGVGVLNSGSGSVGPSGIQVWNNNYYDANGGLGIDLGDNGVTPNDNLDADSGPNSLLNYPVLSSAVAGGGETTVTGSFDSSANSGFTVYLFTTSACDPSGHGEGQSRIGGPISVNTDSSGHATFTDSSAQSVPVGTFFTAVATNASGDTSEFSNCVRVPGAPSATTDAASGVGTNGATLNATVNPDSDATSVHFEYGPTGSYGTSTAPQSAGSDASDHAIAQAIGGLAPGQTIHYRVVATNNEGTVDGSDRVLTTATPPVVVGPAGAPHIDGASGGSGAAQCVVPKLAGKKLSAAKRALAAAHCKLGKVKTRKATKRRGAHKSAKHGTKATPKKGTVIGQSPAAGTQKATGSKVNLTLAG